MQLRLELGVGHGLCGELTQVLEAVGVSQLRIYLADVLHDSAQLAHPSVLYGTGVLSGNQAVNETMHCLVQDRVRVNLAHHSSICAGEVLARRIQRWVDCQFWQVLVALEPVSDQLVDWAEPLAGANLLERRTGISSLRRVGQSLGGNAPASTLHGNLGALWEQRHRKAVSGRCRCVLLLSTRLP